MCVGNTHTLPSPVGAFADHSGEDAVFASVRVQSGSSTGLALKELKSFSFTALCYLPKEQKKVR